MLCDPDSPARRVGSEVEVTDDRRQSRALTSEKWIRRRGVPYPLDSRSARRPRDCSGQHGLQCARVPFEHVDLGVKLDPALPAGDPVHRVVTKDVEVNEVRLWIEESTRDDIVARALPARANP